MKPGAEDRDFKGEIENPLLLRVSLGYFDHFKRKFININTPK
jgi:hypothetical protein